MNEFVTVSASSYDPANLASQLTEKSAEGWSVVAIVPTGGDVTAFLTRASSATAMGSTDNTESAAAMAAASEPVMEPMVMHSMTPEPASEPDGWAVAPAAAASEPVIEPYTPAPSNAPATIIQSSMSPVGGDYQAQYNPGNAYQPQAAAAPAAAAAAPADWYADPAGRFDYRYWNGTTWTEHVTRGGQQFTDNPVA